MSEGETAEPGGTSEFQATPKPVLPTVSAERRRELLAYGRTVRKNLQDRFKPLLEVKESKLNRRLD